MGSTAEDLLWALGDLPIRTSIYKGVSYWTISFKLEHGYLKVRSRRLSDALVQFLKELDSTTEGEE